MQYIHTRSYKSCGKRIAGTGELFHIFLPTLLLEVVSKRQIAFESKAQADEKAQHTWGVCEHFKEVCNTAIGRQMGF